MDIVTLSAVVGAKVAPDVCTELGCLGFSVEPGGLLGSKKGRRRNKEILLVLDLPPEIKQEVTLTEFNQMTLDAEKIITQHKGRFLF